MPGALTRIAVEADDLPMRREATVGMAAAMILAAACVGGDPEIESPPPEGGTPDDAGGAADTASSDAEVDVDGGATLTNNALWLGTGGLPQGACSPFVLDDQANPEVPVLSNGTLTIEAVGDQTEMMRYLHQANVLAVPASNTVVLEARLRVVVSNSTNPARAGAVLGFTIAGKRNYLWLSTTEIFILAGETTKGATLTDAGTGAFHDYRIEANLATGALRVLQDGVEVLTGATYNTGGQNEIVWGESSVVAGGESEWQRFAHNAYVLGPCP
jgi:hypothetical protein